MIHELQQIFHSITKSLEVLYVIEDIKPCARILVYEDDLNKVIDFLGKKRMHYSISDFKVIKQSIQSEFYSDKSIKVGKDDIKKGYFFVYLSKKIETAESAKLMESKNSHKELGLILGYPECCCNFFEMNFNKQDTDLTLKILENSNGYKFLFYTNIAARHFDMSLLSHFPHSFECVPSIKNAQNNLKIIQKYSKELALMLSSLMQSTVIYTLNEGIFLLRKCEKVDDYFVYSDVLTTTKNKLYYLISSNKMLQINGKNNFIINDIKISGPQYGVMVFI